MLPLNCIFSLILLKSPITVLKFIKTSDQAKAKFSTPQVAMSEYVQFSCVKSHLLCPAGLCNDAVSVGEQPFARALPELSGRLAEHGRWPV